MSNPFEFFLERKVSFCVKCGCSHVEGIHIGLVDSISLNETISIGTTECVEPYPLIEHTAVRLGSDFDLVPNANSDAENTYTPIEFTEVIEDSSGAFDPLNPDVITPTTEGKKIFWANVYWENPESDTPRDLTARITCYIGGVASFTVALDRRSSMNVSGPFYPRKDQGRSLSGIFNVQAGDSFKLEVLHRSTGNRKVRAKTTFGFSEMRSLPDPDSLCPPFPTLFGIMVPEIPRGANHVKVPPMISSSGNVTINPNGWASFVAPVTGWYRMGASARCVDNLGDFIRIGTGFHKGDISSYEANPTSVDLAYSDVLQYSDRVMPLPGGAQHLTEYCYTEAHLDEGDVISVVTVCDTHPFSSISFGENSNFFIQLVGS